MIASADKFTHAGLVSRAVDWLRNGAAIPSNYSGPRVLKREYKCHVTLAEARSYISEIPDAIGWAFGGRVSVLVECKASRSDFLRDRKKYFRSRAKYGIGRFRYYLAPKGLIGFDEVPENWGLLELKNPGGRIVVTRAALRQEFDIQAELSVMWSAISAVRWDSVVALRRMRVGMFNEVLVPAHEPEEHY